MKKDLSVKSAQKTKVDILSATVENLKSEKLCSEIALNQDLDPKLGWQTTKKENGSRNGFDNLTGIFVKSHKKEFS
jgi:hypothetical protein